MRLKTNSQYRDSTPNYKDVFTLNKRQRLGLLNAGIINEAVAVLHKTHSHKNTFYNICIYKF